MAKKFKDPHLGGQQMPMFEPSSDWVRLRELPDLRRVGVIAFDTEEKDDGLAQGRGPGWAYGAGFITGMSASWRQGSELESFYAPVRHPDTDCFDDDVVARWIKDHQKAGVRFVMQNAPYDVGWCDRQWDVPCPELVDDTTCMAVMIDETRYEYNLDALCKWRGLPGKDESELVEALSVYGFPTAPAERKKHLWRLPARFVAKYAEVDAIRTLQLRESFLPEIEEQGLQAAYQLEMDLLPMVHAMRKRGIRVDLDAAEQAKERCHATAAQAFQDLGDKLKTRVGIDELRSNGWMRQAFDSEKVRYPVDHRGTASFEAKWMKNVDHWLPKLCVRAKSYHDAADKFIQGFIIDFAHNGRLHASINQFKSEDGGTRTYRFSYSDPPLQQMPARDEELAYLIRGIFLPEPGELWLGADYSQQEYRLIVHFAEKLGLKRAKEAADKYRADPHTDFHSMVAEMTGLARKPAKDTNFAKSYGAGVKKFASMINKSLEEAEAIMKQYDEKMPFVKQMNELLQNKAERTGFIKLLDGARIHFNNWEPAWLSKEERSYGYSHGMKMNSCSREEAEERVDQDGHPWYGKRLRRSDCRKAMNARVQGSAARMTKLAMSACWREGFTPMLQMHDELDFSIAKHEHGKRITEIMRDVVTLSVPVVVDAEYGLTWGDAKHDWATAWAKLAPPPKAKTRGRRARADG